jgi:RNA polymerase sigma-70 factor (ECF subfamily)
MTGPTDPPPTDLSRLLLERWRAGDEQAAAELFQRYAEQLVALTSRRLQGRLAVRVDAEDVVQSVYRSFFAAARQGRYVLQRSGDLWQLLLGITRHKLQQQFKRHTAGKRAVGREISPNDETPTPFVLAAVKADQPGPDEVVALADFLEQTLSRFEPVHRRAIELRLQGHSLDEIAADIGRTRRTVSRILEEFKRQLGEAAGVEPT